MGEKLWFLLLSILTAVILIGCSSDSQEIQSDPDHYPEAKEAAWTFLKNQGWDDTVAGDWKRAEVREITADESHHLLEDAYRGKDALYVIFKNKENLTNGTPNILVDPETNEVMGYTATE
ncbi:hypothetical protein [Jeotgalibacillus malaysiensis]|uniref:hypothetical protein n=1 Tax=Jeotgalibacillus malaysiensis TaxID=1508404 RepID=UPI00384FCFDE